jgi:DsbC/DsbD-like thiol-disulfide interchange protein
VAALSYDSVAILEEFARRQGIRYPLLSDPGSEIIRRFGLLNPEFPEGSPAHGVPFPGTLVVDPRGRVRTKLFEKTYAERRTAGSLLVLEGESGAAAASEVRTDHFVLRLSASNATVAAGNRVTLVLDFEMGEKKHAYAPGVQGYRPLALRLDPQPLVSVHDPVYPAPQDYVYAPLRETVPVFEGRFRVLQDVTLAGGREVAERLRSGDDRLSITGRLDYQVCSDRACFPPASLPVTWTLKLVPLDRERSPEALRPK